MGILKEFKEFAVKGNVIDLAIGVIIGAAFGKIVSSLVEDIIMPLVNPLIPGGKWQEMKVYPGIKLGSFFSVTLNFLIVAFVLFLVVKGINAMKKKEVAATDVPPELLPQTRTEILLMEILDTLKSNEKNKDRTV